MKTKMITRTASVMVALSFGLMAGVRAQETLDVPTPRTEQTDTLSHRSNITRFNKASDLIGMNVKNHLGENLGEIKDLVVDLQTGRISYAVLATGGFLGIGDKYIAIPPSAFTSDDVDMKLVLNADKTKIQQAPGFAKNNWPEVENPAWGAYWGADDLLNDRQGQLGKDRLADRLGLDHAADRLTFKGKITVIDADKRIIKVQGDLGTQEFEVHRTVKFWKDTVKLSDLRVGDEVMVTYKKDAKEKMVVYSVRRVE